MKNLYIKVTKENEKEAIEFAEDEGYKKLGPTWDTFKTDGLLVMEAFGDYYYSGDSEESIIKRGFVLLPYPESKNGSTEKCR